MNNRNIKKTCKNNENNNTAYNKNEGKNKIQVIPNN